MVPPVNEIVHVRFVDVSVPPHCEVVASATLRPAGSVSENATPASPIALAAGLVSVNVSDDVALSGVVAGLNALAIAGGATTSMLAWAELLLVTRVSVPLSNVNGSATLFCVPAAMPVTSTLNRQLPPLPAGKLSP